MACTADTAHFLRRRDLHQLLRATLRAIAQIKMIPHQQQKRIASHELPRAMDRVPITQQLPFPTNFAVARGARRRSERSLVSAVV